MFMVISMKDYNIPKFSPKFVQNTESYEQNMFYNGYYLFILFL
jgi:hypothetical protein